MLTISNLHLKRDSTVILNDISLHLEQGELIAIVGPNGSGKSSFIRCISGWLQPTQGSLLYNGKPLDSFVHSKRAEALSWLPQRPNILEDVQVIELIKAARYRFQESRQQQVEQARLALAKAQISNLEERYWSSLSGGEAQRVALAGLIAQDATIWLMDEPANHLDPLVQRRIYKTLTQEWLQGRTMLIVTHNLNLLLGSIPREHHDSVRTLGFQQGRLAFETKLSSPDLASHLQRLYDIPIQIIQVFEQPYLVFGQTR